MYNVCLYVALDIRDVAYSIFIGDLVVVGILSFVYVERGMEGGFDTGN